MQKTALVISGGGSKGAFAVGALSFIHQNVRPIDQFDLYCGTSTGSLIAPLAALGEMALLETIYTTTRQTDVLNVGGILNLLTQVSIHDATPLKQLIDRTLTDARWTELQTRQTPLFLTGVCLQTERLVYFTTQPAPSSPHYDLVPLTSATDLRRAMLASSCQPVFMQPVELRPGARPVRQYADGGVRETTPLQAAIDNGAETILAISLSPAQTPTNDTRVATGLTMLERTISMFSEDVSEGDYRVARLYEQGNQYVAAVRAQLLADGVPAALVNVAFGQAGNPFGQTAVASLLEIRPEKALDEGGPGGLTFDPPAMRQMFQKGFARAKAFFQTAPQPIVV